MSRIGQTDEAQVQSSFSLQAARNEYEPFQVIVTACGKALTISDVAMTPFSGPGSISSENITIYREHYVDVTQASPYSPFPLQSYPDALIPLKHPVTGADLNGAVYDAVPYSLADQNNQPFWVDVFIPSNAPPGNYSSELLVTTTDGQTATVSISLTVWSFVLPYESHQATSFGLDDREISQFYGYDFNNQRENFFPLVRQYYDTLLDHRVSPHFPIDAVPLLNQESGDIDFDTILFDGLGTTAAENLDYYINERMMSAMRLPVYENWPYDDPLNADRQSVTNYIFNWYDYFDQQNYPNRLYVYTVDEPRTAEAYDAIRVWGEIVNEADNRLDGRIKAKYLITEQPVPGDPAWGDLYGAIDIWAPCCDTVWVDLESETGEKIITQRQDLGEEVWWYTALAQPSGEWLAENGKPTVLNENYAPVWLIDYPTMNFRVPTWINYIHGITGLEYWEVIHWEEVNDVWAEPGTYSLPDGVIGTNVYNGDGSFFYPGSKETIGFDGPIASMRIKWIRESLEDYEYFYLLAEEGEEAFLSDQMSLVATGLGDWTLNQSRLYAARSQLGTHLDEIYRDRITTTYIPLVIHETEASGALDQFHYIFGTSGVLHHSYIR